MSRHPRDRWEYPAGPGDHRFDYRFDNQVPLSYDQSQERPYPVFNRHDPYYPEAREDFHYRERSPLRRYGNPPDPYHYESYDYADAYRRRPVYDPQSYPTHGDFTPDDADIMEDVVMEEYHPNEWEDEDEDLVVVRRSWRPRGRDPHTDSGTKAAETNGVGASGASTSGAGTSGAGVNGTRPSGSSLTEAEPELVPDHRVPNQQPDVEMSCVPLSIVPKQICQEIASLLVSGVTTVQSKEVSKEFPLKFEEEGFSLMPPKLDSWMSRRAKEKGVFKLVNAREEALVKTQLKIMDIGPPLIDAYAKLTAVADESAVTLRIRRSIQAALQQWGRAFAHISKKRRDAVVNVTDPRVEYLLKDENVFATGKEARELLFTGNFLDLMLKEASQDETLARRDKAIAVATRGRRNPVRSTRRDQPRDPPSRQVHFGDYQQSDRGRGRGRRVFMDLRGGRGRGNISRRYELSHILPSSPRSCNYSPERAKVGARLLGFAHYWTTVTDDQWVLNTVTNGLVIHFLSPPVQHSLPHEVVMSDEMQSICNSELSSLLKKRAVTEVTERSDGFVCSFFCVPKKGGGFRPIVNLKPLNQFIAYEHFKMENLETVRYLVRKGDWFLKLDLKDAYLTVPVNRSQQKYLRFAWRGRVYQFGCMAFGLSPAPRIFTKILKVVVSFLRRRGIRIVVYLDDFLLMNESEEGARADLETALHLLQSLGFLINWEKSVTTPTRVIEYLGMVIDSTRLSFALPTVKVQEVKKMCKKALDTGQVPLRDVASILGNFTWAIPTIPFAQSHYRSMQRFYITESQKALGDLNVKCVLSVGSRSDLQWWVANLEEANGKEFFPKIADMEIYSDASRSGWGAICDGVTTRGPWTTDQSAMHINCLELLGALYALQSFAKEAHGLSIRMHLDNSTAVCYINKGGGTKSAELTKIAKEIASFCERQQLSIVANHLAGVLNVEADRESRAISDASDWMLDRAIFRELQNIWPTEIDLFSSFWNAQLPAYVSWRPQPESTAVNAFSINWSGLVGYAFPPFALLSKCLEKIRKEAANIIMVCPVWPAQPWFPVLLELACDVPLLLRSSPKLLMSAKGEPHPLLETGALQLAVWKLSGKSSAGRGFRSHWSTYSWPVTELQPIRHTSRHGGVGMIGVFDGVRIPCRIL